MCQDRVCMGQVNILMMVDKYAWIVHHEMHDLGAECATECRISV